MVRCVKIGQHTVSALVWNKDSSVSTTRARSVPMTHWLLCKPVYSVKQNQQMNGCDFNSTHFFDKWSWEHLNRPFFFFFFATLMALKPLKEHSGRRRRVTFTASQRVKERWGGGVEEGGASERQGVPLCWPWWMSGSQQVLEKAFASTQGDSQMTWLTAQRT